MNTILKVEVVLKRRPLSRRAVQALYALSRYDRIVFTSKNARQFFVQTLRERGIALPEPRQVVQVGPRATLLTLPLKGKRILFPRSAAAPHDIVRRLRARGTVVRTLQLYSTKGSPLTPTQRRALLVGVTKKLYFKSPSGVSGLLRQLSRKDRHQVLGLPACCIGETTAGAARRAGFKKVIITGIL